MGHNNKTISLYMGRKIKVEENESAKSPRTSNIKMYFHVGSKNWLVHHSHLLSHQTRSFVSNKTKQPQLLLHSLSLSPPLPFSFEFHFFFLSLSLSNEEHGRLGTSSDSRDPIRSANTGASFPDSGGRPSCRIREYADERRFYSRPRYHLLWSHHYLHHRHQRTHLFRLTVLAELITCLRKVFSSPLLFVLSSFSKIDVRSGIFGYL